MSGLYSKPIQNNHTWPGYEYGQATYNDSVGSDFFNLSSRKKFCQKNSNYSFRISVNCSFEQLFDRKPTTDVYLCCSFIIFFI